VRRQHLSVRSPLSCFHNGMAKDLWAMVDFYNTRFNIGLAKDENEINLGRGSPGRGSPPAFRTVLPCELGQPPANEPPLSPRDLKANR
jgi:hypothetical protein